MAETPLEQNVSISSGTIVRFILFVVILLALYYLSDIVLVVLAAVIIASSVEPIVRRLKHYQ